MTQEHTYRIEPAAGSLVEGVQLFFKKMLNTGMVNALLLPTGDDDGSSVMPALVTDPERLERAVPFSPAFPLNAGRMASRISYRDSGRNTAVFMRPCEHRAFIELVKLKQGKRDELILIGYDCCGALNWSDFKDYADNTNPSGDDFLKQVFSGGTEIFEKGVEGYQFSKACRTCEGCFPVNTDINFILHGTDLSAGIIVKGITDKGAKLLEAMELPTAQMPSGRDEIVEQIQNSRAEVNASMMEEIEEQTNTIAKLDSFFSRCINCYNCRNMCPVCYCRECVFNTDVFSHQPIQYLQWAEKKGSFKMPADTLFYHLTRMAHMSHACVGCGQCSNACPSDIPVFEVFKSVGKLTQDAFEYRPGVDEEQAPPLSVFREKEFEDVVGIDN